MFTSRRHGSSCVLTVGTVGLAVGLALAGCSSSSSASSRSGAKDAPYHILAVYGMTGALESSGVAVNRGVEAAVDYFNSQGGVDGHKLVLTTDNDQSNTTTAASLLLSALSSSSPPDYVIPGISSNEALAMAPLMTRYKAVGLGSATDPSLDNPAKYPYFFAQGWLASTAVAVAADWIASHPGVTKVAIITSNDALGQSDVPTFQTTLKAKGISSVVELFDPTATDYTATFQAAAAAKPSWVWMDGAGSEVPVMLSSRVKANLGSVPTVIGNVASSGPLLTYAKGTNELANTYATLGPMGALVPAAQQGPQFKAMLGLLGKQGPLVAPLFVYATGWDYVNYFVMGAKNLHGKPLTGPDLANSFEHLPTPTDPQFPMYRPTFTPTTHNPRVQPSAFTFGEEVGSQNGMIVLKQAYQG